MIKVFFLFIFLFILSCSVNKTVYWCGDHPCINKKEKESYFKKTMIVEVKQIKKDLNKNNSELEIIAQRAMKDEKKRIKEETR